MAATAQEFADLLEPKLSNIWHDSYPAYESKFGKIFNLRPMPKNTITDYEIAGFGALQDQPDNDEISFDDPLTGNKKSYTYSVRGLAYRVGERLWRNDLYGEVENFEDDLMDSARDDSETAAASIFNNGFATTNTGFDGLQLFSTSHTRLDGGAVQANRPSTDAALSVSALHAGYIQFLKWKNHRGRPRSFKPNTLIIPPDLIVTAWEILDSQLKPGTALNDKNVISRFGLGAPLDWQYLTSTTAWFLTGDGHDLNWFWRFRPETGMRTEWKTESIERKVRQGYVTGFGQWLGTYGTDGVA